MDPDEAPETIFIYAASDEQIQSAILSIFNVGYGTEILQRIRSDWNFSKNPDIAAILNRLQE